jgi:predicted nucleotidyltransferase
MRAREGDLIKTNDCVIFDVKGLVHPPNKVIAFPRYIPSPDGTRENKGKTYSKVYNLEERFKYLQKVKPQLLVDDPVFGETLCEVPKEAIKKHFDPISSLESMRKSHKLESLKQKAVKFAEELKTAACIPWSSIGISGSVMGELFTQLSDIDPIVYGSENCRKAYSSLKILQKTENSGFRPYTNDQLKTLFNFRSKDTMMTFDDFRKVEARKAFQGMYDGTDYFVRFVKDWSEVKECYGDVVYKNAGYTKLSATVSDVSDALFTPCTYKLENVDVIEGTKLAPLEQVISFRGRFCKQAEENENILVQGKAEYVTDKRRNRSWYRIIIGNKPTDYMVLQ